MKPLQIIRQVSKVLKNQRCTFCLIGGHAASLYRSQERFTKDVDFAIVGQPSSTSRGVAEKAIEKIGLKSVLGFIPGTGTTNKRKGICFITSAPSPGELKGVIDIILPELPWVTDAVERAQSNLIDLGFDKIPVITPEDLIIAKCYAVNNSPDRFQDLDDLKEIFQNIKDLDFGYIKEKLSWLKIALPKQIRKYSRGR